jgi:hypothetical protein
VTALADACADIGPLLARAAALITEPDADAASQSGRGTMARAHASRSRPPWNPAAADACYDAHAVIRDTLALFQFLVTGRAGQPRPYAATGATLSTVQNLGHAVTRDRARQAARDLSRCATVIMQLPAVDEAEHAQRVGAECPYCRFPMMLVYPKSGRVTCMRYGTCFDGDGQHPVGMADRGRLGPCIAWSDGLVT